MINAKHLRLHVIRPTLEYLDPVIPYSIDAENLLMGTCAQESHMGEYLVQLDNGPARGIYQMEPATQDDVYLNFLRHRPVMQDQIDTLFNMALSPDLNLIANLPYATAICRAQYYRFREPLPDGNDIEGMAHYWKCYWNTVLGKGTASQFMASYDRLVKS